MNESRESWLFLRGLTRGAGHWGDFPQILQKELKLSDVFFVDLPGNGEEFKEQSPWAISDYVSFVRERALKKKKSAKLNVVAISMGAMITVEWMKLFPSEINQAFLINTSASNLSLPHQRFQIRNFVQNLFAAGLSREAKILNLSSNNRSRSQEFLPALSAYSKDHPVTFRNAFSQIFAAATYSFPLTPPGSIVLLASEKDRLVSVECSRAIAEIWKTPLETNQSAGHDLPLDDPQWLVEKIKQRCL
jgi:pimeloyl-ACP methyl ester carboxylesterase